mmetsp:Transcript_20420/g.28720  ORF Transcript_20420/g.28720 Transcript_20420/m.28720 type:complete len:185 (+) Transcript_20420:993-1547(+)
MGMCPISTDLSQCLVSQKMPQSIQKYYRLEGLVSKAPGSVSSGKAARDLQFFSINGRPVELPKISRAIGEIWRSFDCIKSNGECRKKPACVLAITIPNSMYDINIAPDKREVLLNEEDSICQIIQNTVSRIWTSQIVGKFKANEVENLSKDMKSNNNIKADSDNKTNNFVDLPLQRTTFRQTMR